MRDETVQYNGDDPAPAGSGDGTANSGIPEPSSGEAETMPHATPRSPAGGSALHVRCPHCHNPIELLPDAQLESIQCPSCGSDFSLVDDEAAGTRDARGVTQVGHFKLVERVGMGAFGSVWKALDTNLDRTVAVKIPRAGQLTPKQQEQFVREARAAAQLRHPNIVPVHEVGREGDTLYIVSDFVRGLTLADWLTGQRPTMREAAELCVVVAEALHHAHEQGVVHRDLKPGNIMLDEEGQPHLMDFGLAKREAGEITVTQEGNVLGTPAYMAPEQARGDSHDADRRADVYSLGVILFQLLTGELPFRGNARMLIHQVVHDEPPSPRKLNSAVPRDLETITLKCLEKAPEKRYASAEALGEELGRWLRGEPIKARPISATERAWRWARREPVVAGLTAAIVGLLAAAALVGFAVAAKQSELAAAAGRNAQEARASAERVNVALERSREAELAAKEAQQAAAQQRDSATTLLGAHYTAQAGALMEDQPARAAALLSKVPDPCRNFAWRLVSRRVSPVARELRASKDLPAHITYSPNGSLLAALSGRSVAIWDVRGKVLLKRMPLSCGLNDMQFAPDGGCIALSCEDGCVRLLTPPEWTVTRTLSGHRGAVQSAVFDKDGQSLVTGGIDGSIRVWSLEDGAITKTHRSYDDQPIRTLFLNERGDALYALQDRRDLLVVQNLSNGSVKHFNKKTDAPKSWHIHGLSISPDRRSLLTTAYDWRIHCWDANSLAKLWESDSLFYEQPYEVAYDPSGRRFATFSGDGALRIRDATNGEVLSIVGSSNSWGPIKWSPDGLRIVVPGRGGFIREFVNPRKADIVVNADALNCFAWHPRRPRLITGGPGGRLSVYSLDGTVRSETYIDGIGDIHALAPSSDGKNLFAVGERGIARLALRPASIVLEHFTPSRGLTCMSLAPDAETLIVGDNRGMLHVHNSDTLDRGQSHDDETAAVTSLSHSPNGAFLSSAGQWKHTHVITGSCFVRNSHDLKEKRIRYGHNSFETSSAFSPDSTILATGSADRRILLRQLPLGKPFSELVGHSSTIRSLSFSQDGRLLASCDDDSVCLWDVPAGLKLVEWPVSGGKVVSVSFSTDGTKLAAGSTDGTILVWTNREPTPEVTLTDETEDLSALQSRVARSVARAEWRDATSASVAALDVMPEGVWPMFGERPTICRLVASNDELFASVAAARMDDADLWVARGWHFAARNDWARAAACYERLCADQLRGDAICEYACLKMLLGEKATCKKIIAMHSGTEAGSEKTSAISEDAVSRYARIRADGVCALSVDTPARLLDAARSELTAARSSWHLHAVALAQLRCGEYEAAIAISKESNERDWASQLAQVQNWFVMALAARRLGDHRDAEEYLAEARRLVSKIPNAENYDYRILPVPDLLATEVLRREAERAFATDD